jgi:threonine/homoserine/homoserine lactone efflux protein
MLFFVAFFPQFLDRNTAATPQLILMAATFMVLTIVLDTTYALLSARVGQALQDPRRIVFRNRVSAAILMAAAVALALVNF